jgi:glycosyltransferase involved in cell wall biosynthesis
VVIIGRNEGERLKRCLRSVLAQAKTAVYVDSGSTDGSVGFAKSLGVGTVDLDMSVPFTAGRARNAGFEYLRGAEPGLEYVQYVDGDCELCEGWMEAALDFLEGHPDYAIATGRVKERNPEKTIYNELCDMEWASAPGESQSCGGIFLSRAQAIAQAGGFNQSLIAGEEPELCLRLRRAGWRIYNIDMLMTLHDADMRHFRQWWKRTVRSGFAYANRYFLHLGANEPELKNALFRVWLWVVAVPAAAALLAAFISPWALSLLSVYAVQLFRSYRSTLKVTGKKGPSLRYAFFNVIGKLPQLVGQVSFYWKRALKRDARIIEYK